MVKVEIYKEKTTQTTIWRFGTFIPSSDNYTHKGTDIYIVLKNQNS